MAVKEKFATTEKEPTGCPPIVRRGLPSAEMERLKQTIVEPPHPPSDAAREALRTYKRLMVETVER